MRLDPIEGESGATSSRGRLQRILAAIVVGVYAAFAIVAVMNTHNRVGIGGTPLFYDFSTFYQAGQFADQGRAATAYDNAAMAAAQKAVFPGARVRLPWNYPPTFQLMMMPFAMLPYVVAWALWSVLTYGGFAWFSRNLVTQERRWLIVLAPGAALNLLFGQNGLLTTMLMGAGVVFLQRRPFVAGVLLGLLTYKPQFALLIPLVLVVGREWRALAAAVISASALLLLSIAVLGVEPLVAFLHKALHPALVIATSSSDWRGVPTAETMLRTLGVSETFSAGAGWLLAAATAVAACWIWLRTRDGLIRASALACASLLVAPYLRPYDMVLLILPLALLFEAPARGAGAFLVRAVAIVAWVTPAALTFTNPRIQYGPTVVLTVLGLVLWLCLKGELEPRSAVPVGSTW